MKHSLHKKVGQLLEELREEMKLPPTAILLDRACKEGGKNIPLFIDDKVKGNDTEICNVDALIILDGTIRLIIEVEESNIKPTHIYGKYLASATAQCHIHANGSPVYIKQATFIQILCSKGLHETKSKKKKQARWIEKSIQAKCKVEKSIRRYRLFWDMEEDAIKIRFMNVVRVALRYPK